MFKSGIYRTTESFLCFYENENFVGFYISGKNDFRQHKEKRFDYHGEYKIDRNDFALAINDPFYKTHIVFSGYFDNDKLHIERYRANDPDKITHEIYEYIGTE